MSWSYNPFTGELDQTSTGNFLSETPADPSMLENIGFTCNYSSDDGGKLVITLTAIDGTTLSASNKGRMIIRNPDSSFFGGDPVTTEYRSIEITSPLTYEIRSGDTFGGSSGREDRIHVQIGYNDSEGAPFIICQGGLNLRPEDLINVQAVAYGARTARFGAYAPPGTSTSGTNNAHRVLGYIKYTETTIGTWTKDPTSVHLHDGSVSDEFTTVYGSYKKTTAQTIPTTTMTIVDFNSSNLRTGWSATTGASWAGRLTVGAAVAINARIEFEEAGGASGDSAWTAGSYVEMWLYRNGAAVHAIDRKYIGVDNVTTATWDLPVMLQGWGTITNLIPGDTFDIRVYHNDAASHSIAGLGDYNLIMPTKWNFVAG